MTDTMAPTTYRYFAYGSNMLTRRLTAADRAPSATPVRIGYVEGRRLTFDKVNRDGSGKCDAEATGREADRVYGVVFEVALADKVALNDAEGLGNGYTNECVEVVVGEQRIEVEAYIATRKTPALRPYHWYKALTVAGAVEHRLPTDYVEWLKTFESVDDPNSERRAKFEALLGAR